MGPKKSIKLCQLHVNIYSHFFVISESLLEIRAEGAWEVGEKKKISSVFLALLAFPGLVRESQPGSFLIAGGTIWSTPPCEEMDGGGDMM